MDHHFQVIIKSIILWGWFVLPNLPEVNGKITGASKIRSQAQVRLLIIVLWPIQVVMVSHFHGIG